MQVRAMRIVAFALAAAAAPALGHHSHANYWETEWVNLEGTIQQVHWVNPHTWIYLDVADGAEELHIGSWALEGASVTSLRRDGWSPEMLAPGRTISVRCHPMKDGSRGCLMGFILMDDGTEREFD